MAGSLRILIGCALMVAAMLQCIEAQTTHVVGDSLGWEVPPGGPIAYSTWASTQTFKVGDILVFNFVNGTHDVARVPKETFDACNTTGTTIGDVITISPARITLDTEGEYYFISTQPRQCFFGQKLAINVTSSSGPTTHVVGGSLGWLVPSAGDIAYKTWASTQTFKIGDILLFNFVNETGDVAEVTKDSYKSCNTTVTIGPVLTTSPAKITLVSGGEHYYTSTLDQRCSLGQKLAINVTGTAAPSPSPSATATPPSTAAYSPTTAPQPTTGAPYSSAPSFAVAGFSVTFLSLAVAFLV